MSPPPYHLDLSDRRIHTTMCLIGILTVVLLIIHCNGGNLKSSLFSALRGKYIYDSREKTALKAQFSAPAFNWFIVNRDRKHTAACTTTNLRQSVTEIPEMETCCDEGTQHSNV